MLKKARKLLVKYIHAKPLREFLHKYVSVLKMSNNEATSILIHKGLCTKLIILDVL